MRARHVSGALNLGGTSSGEALALAEVTVSPTTKAVHGRVFCPALARGQVAVVAELIEAVKDPLVVGWAVGE